MEQNHLSKCYNRNLQYMRICQRAQNMGILHGDALEALMDIESADIKFHLHLNDFLSADDNRFSNDFIGIQQNIHRNIYPATNFGDFLPEFAAN